MEERERKENQERKAKKTEKEEARKSNWNEIVIHLINRVKVFLT